MSSMHTLDPAVILALLSMVQLTRMDLVSVMNKSLQPRGPGQPRQKLKDQQLSNTHVVWSRLLDRINLTQPAKIDRPMGQHDRQQENNTRVNDPSQLGMEELPQFVAENSEEPKVRHKKSLQPNSKGKYTTKEEVQRPPSEDHPCRLTRTTIEISFPDMKSELFIDFLGYKEPNLITLMRCKGLCAEKGSDVDIDCVPTKIRKKKVKMLVKTKLSDREPLQKTKELELEEHLECGCRCPEEISNNCVGGFNNKTCTCNCPADRFAGPRLHCELARNSYWDSDTCTCRTRSVATRGAAEPPEDGLRATRGGQLGPSDTDCNQQVDTFLNSQLLFRQHKTGDAPQPSQTSLEVISLLMLGIFLVASIFFAAATLHYRKKVINLRLRKLSFQDEESASADRELQARPQPPPCSGSSGSKWCKPIPEAPRGAAPLLCNNKSCGSGGGFADNGNCATFNRRSDYRSDSGPRNGSSKRRTYRGGGRNGEQQARSSYSSSSARPSSLAQQSDCGITAAAPLPAKSALKKKSERKGRLRFMRRKRKKGDGMEGGALAKMIRKQQEQMGAAGQGKPSLFGDPHFFMAPMVSVGLEDLLSLHDSKVIDEYDEHGVKIEKDQPGVWSQLF